MTRDQAIKAIEDSFESRIDHLNEVFIEGLIEGEPITELIARFDRGFALTRESHDQLRADIETHFTGQHTS